MRPAFIGLKMKTRFGIHKVENLLDGAWLPVPTLSNQGVVDTPPLKISVPLKPSIAAHGALLFDEGRNLAFDGPVAVIFVFRQAKGPNAGPLDAAKMPSGIALDLGAERPASDLSLKDLPHKVVVQPALADEIRMGCQDDEAIAAGADRGESVIGQGLAYTVFLVIPVTSGIKESVMNRPARREAVFDGILPMVLSVVIGLVGIKGGLP